MIPIFKSRKDRLKPYLSSLLRGFVFTEVSREFLLGPADLGFMEGVPFPINEEDLRSFADSGASTIKLADNMAVVIGCDPQFVYTDKYLQYLHRHFDDRLVNAFCGKAQENLKIGNYRKGMAYLRAAMLFRDESLEAMFSYASGCRYWYLQLEGSEEDQELIKILKSEANEYFEHCTSAYPEFAGGWYYLGYAYLNAGQYLKAQIAWRHYLEAAKASGQEDEESIKEISDRVASLEDPVKLERGIGLVASGQIMEGLAILEPYVCTDYDKWWPLHFCLAGAYRELGHVQEAAEGYLKVLQLSPSNTDAMDALAEIYAQLGDAEKSEKYRNKAALVRSDLSGGEGSQLN